MAYSIILQWSKLFYKSDMKKSKKLSSAILQLYVLIIQCRITITHPSPNTQTYCTHTYTHRYHYSNSPAGCQFIVLADKWLLKKLNKTEVNKETSHYSTSDYCLLSASFSWEHFSKKQCSFQCHWNTVPLIYITVETNGLIYNLLLLKNMRGHEKHN